jgi:hypothetical protein
VDIKAINASIEKMVSDKIQNGQPVAMSWVTQEIIEAHNDIEGPDTEFYIVCARHYISDQVKRQIKKYEPSDSASDAQLIMEGFEHLQKAYPVERDDERVIMPIDMMTDEEVEKRAEEYKAMAAGCLNHAKELIQYLEQRNPALNQGVIGMI